MPLIVIDDADIIAMPYFAAVTPPLFLPFIIDALRYFRCFRHYHLIFFLLRHCR